MAIPHPPLASRPVDGRPVTREGSRLRVSYQRATVGSGEDWGRLENACPGEGQSWVSVAAREPRLQITRPSRLSQEPRFTYEIPGFIKVGT